MQALPKCCLLGRTLASGGHREYPRYQTSSPFQDCCFSRSREARDSARATLQAMTLAWEEQWLKCTMSYGTTPMAISDTLEASTGPGRSSSSRRKGCTPLLQPWCGSRNRRGTSPSIGSRSLGRVWPCQQPSHHLNCLWILALPEKRQNKASSLLSFAVSATVLVPPSGSTKSQMTMVGVARWMCGRACLCGALQSMPQTCREYR